MNARLLKITAIVSLAILVIVGAFFALSAAGQNAVGIPVTGNSLPANEQSVKPGAFPLSMPAFNGELDLGQQDERAKLSALPLRMPAFNGELDLGQQDEQAKLSALPLRMPAYNGELDLGQQDEQAKQGH